MGLIAASCVTAVVTACTENAPAAPESAFTGTWDLVEVNGAALPFVISSNSLDGSRRLLIAGQIVPHTRGRVYDVRQTVWQRVNGQRFDFVTDTTTSPYSATPSELLVRRYALLASSDWVDSGAVNGTQLQLRSRYIDQQFGPFWNVRLTYTRRP